MVGSRGVKPTIADSRRILSMEWLLEGIAWRPSSCQ
jgi:hypothetical protein